MGRPMVIPVGPLTFKGPEQISTIYPSLEELEGWEDKNDNEKLDWIAKGGGPGN